jgi:hypothetical protein
MIFAQVLPGITTTDLQLAIGVALVVVLNTVLSQLFAKRGFGIAYAGQQFVVLAFANSLVMVAYTIIRSTYDFPVRLTNAFFFVFLFSLLITLFDQYKLVYLVRFSSVDGIIQDQPELEETGSEV